MAITERDRKRIIKRMSTSYFKCPICERAVDLDSRTVDLGAIEYVKTARGTINVYHTRCCEKYLQKGGLTNGTT